MENFPFEQNPSKSKRRRLSTDKDLLKKNLTLLERKIYQGRISRKT